MFQLPFMPACCWDLCVVVGFPATFYIRLGPCFLVVGLHFEMLAPGGLIIKSGPTRETYNTTGNVSLSKSKERCYRVDSKNDLLEIFRHQCRVFVLQKIQKPSDPVSTVSTQMLFKRKYVLVREE